MAPYRVRDAAAPCKNVPPRRVPGARNLLISEGVRLVRTLL